VLDIGCGARFPFSLLAAAEGAHITALDVMYLKPHPLYDLIVSKAVLEHVYDVEKYFREASRVLKKGGLNY
jgi:2-polyprenyl-3-methyl-5-hydroxy-6-metoxy-1,4-benzoquinol methylase